MEIVLLLDEKRALEEEAGDVSLQAARERREMETGKGALRQQVVVRWCGGAVAQWRRRLRRSRLQLPPA